MSNKNTLTNALRLSTEALNLLELYPPELVETRQRDLYECLNILRRFNRRLEHITHLYDEDQRKVTEATDVQP